MKTCVKCAVEKRIEEYNKEPSNRDGFRHVCRACDKLWHAAYRVKNAARLSEQNKQRYQEMKHVYAAKFAEYRLNHPDRVKETKKKSEAKNKSRVSEYKKAWYQKNKVRIASIAKEAWNNISEEGRLLANQKGAKWKRENPGKRQISQARRRARKMNAGGSYTLADVERLMRSQKCKCVVCRTCIKKVYHIDHITPLAGGGDNSANNLQLLCPPCNLKKNRKDPIEFMQMNGFLL